MQCTNPQNYYPNGLFKTNKPPCGACLACLTTKRFEWASRLMLEATAHDHVQFVTLTFSPENLPASLTPLKNIFQTWTKRLNRADHKQPRYYACMELGTQYGRPHFHALIFGRESSFETRHHNGKEYKVDPIIEDTWGHGLTYVKDCPPGQALANVAIYVVNYLLKNTWDSKDSDSLEWALMSRKPYIGKPGLKWLTDVIGTKKGLQRIKHLGTIPNKVKLSGKFWMIPLRMRRELGEHFQIPVLELPHHDNTVVDFVTHQIIIGHPKTPQTLGEAQANQLRLKDKITRLKRNNKSNDNG
nr:MAG: replication initiation protein [Microvirus sp.]